MDLAAPAIDPESPAPIEPAINAPAVSRIDRDAAVSRLVDHARPFARTPARDKAAMLRATLPRLLEIAPEMAAHVARRRGLDPESDAAAEAWIAGPAAVIAYAKRLAESLEDIASMGRPALDARDIVKRPDGHLVARLTPRSWTTRTAHRDRETFVLFASGCEQEDVIAGQAAFYRERDPEGGVALVVASPTDAGLGLADALHSLFVEGRVVALVPSLEADGALIERALAPICERGFLRVLRADATDIADLASHTAVSAVHLAGDADTFDHLVWGPGGADRDRRKAAMEPLFAKPITTALGGVCPVIVVPCLYSKDELLFIATRISSALAHGAGFDRASPRVIVISSSWPQRDMFLDLLAQRFAAIPPRSAYVTGGAASPWTLAPSLDPSAAEPMFSATTGTSIGIVRLISNDPVEHLIASTAFCNERLVGSLSAEIVVHPIHEEDAVIGDAVDRAVIGLRYGAVGVNQWPATIRFDGVAPWGAYPGATTVDPRSGLGFRNDALMLPRVDKAVIRGPLRSPRSLSYFQPDPKAAQIARRLPSFVAEPKVSDLWALVGR